MAISPLAGKPAPKELLVDLAVLEHEYYARQPDVSNPNQLISFGTSGHRGSPLRGTFTEAHILAITQAICDYRSRKATDGPLYMGKDTHALSGPAQRTALEVLAANGVETIIQRDDGVTPTPVISRAILVYNRGRMKHRCDGIVITPSHNPPDDGGFKYNEIYRLNIDVVNPKVDPTFAFMTVDHDGKIRMDCSSPYAMARIVGLKERYRVAFANDPDSDRHGIVTPSAGLMNPNHYLAVAIGYLLKHRPQLPAHAAVGKTLVSSSMIDRVVERGGRRVCEVPVGFKRFKAGLVDGSYCFGGEESAGASFLRHDGTVWTTDKDGPIMDLLPAEITARTGKDPGEHYRELMAELCTALYTRIDAPATPEQKARLQALSPDNVQDQDHMSTIVREAQAIVSNAMKLTVTGPRPAGGLA